MAARLYPTMLTRLAQSSAASAFSAAKRRQLILVVPIAIGLTVRRPQRKRKIRMKPVGCRAIAASARAKAGFAVQRVRRG